MCSSSLPFIVRSLFACSTLNYYCLELAYSVTSTCDQAILSCRRRRLARHAHLFLSLVPFVQTTLHALFHLCRPFAELATAGSSRLQLPPLCASSAIRQSSTKHPLSALPDNPALHRYAAMPPPASEGELPNSTGARLSRFRRTEALQTRRGRGKCTHTSCAQLSLTAVGRGSLVPVAMLMLDRNVLIAPRLTRRRFACAVGRRAMRVDHVSSSALRCDLLVLSLTRRWLIDYGGKRLIYTMADPVWRATSS